MDDDYVVLADATLYYLAKLRAAIGGHGPMGESASRLLLAAFRAFGPGCVDHIEGDFAFLTGAHVACSVRATSPVVVLSF